MHLCCSGVRFRFVKFNKNNSGFSPQLHISAVEIFRFFSRFSEIIKSCVPKAVQFFLENCQLLENIKLPFHRHFGETDFW